MIALTVADIARIVGGQVVDADPDARVLSVVVDSRAAEPDCMYVAIPGDRVDGHDFAAAAVEAGAAVVLAQRAIDAPGILVEDTVVALGLLAQHARRQLTGCVVVAVTGSSGKTSTKDLLASVLSALGPTVAPVGSFNTEVGVPLTILRADASTRVLILEMGMRGIGHIDYLCAIAEPEIGVLLNIGSAHLGMLGSREQVASAKGELIASLPARGTAILNADDPLVRARMSTTAARTVLVGRAEDAEVRATEVALDAMARPSFTLIAPEGRAHVSLSVHGEHFVANALAVAGVAVALGMGVDEIAARLSAATIASSWRMEISETAAGVVVVNDAYNANPESMRAALETLAAMGRDRRTWAVLGEMLELGEDSVGEHRAVGRLAAKLGVQHLICVGPGGAAIHEGFTSDLPHAGTSIEVEQPGDAVAALHARLQPGDIVLVKASRGIGLDRVAAALTEQDLA